MNNRSCRALLFLGRTDLRFPEKEATTPIVTFPLAFFILRDLKSAPIAFAYADTILITSCHLAEASNLAMNSLAYH